MKLTDKSPMPFGIHQGTKMANVPPGYLVWLWDEHYTHTKPKGFQAQAVKDYIQDNLDVLQQELRRDD